MKEIDRVELKPGSYEELLPNFSHDYPYIASYVDLGRYRGRQCPWHWHKEVEVFYVEKGALEYDTPQGKTVFSEGSGGFVNSNVLHMTKAAGTQTRVTSMIHIFDPILISGWKGSTIDRKFVLPLVAASGTEVIGLDPERPEHGELLEALRQSFAISEREPDYEIRLRAALTGLWYGFLKAAKPLGQEREGGSRSSDKVKMMMAFIHKHCGEKLTVADIAASAYISERECFRAFHDCLNLTPVEYMTDYRIQMACHLLTESREPITGISHTCGMGSSSYFGKVFRERMGLSPSQYRDKWQNNDII